MTNEGRGCLVALNTQTWGRFFSIARGGVRVLGSWYGHPPGTSHTHTHTLTHSPIHPFTYSPGISVIQSRSLICLLRPDGGRPSPLVCIANDLPASSSAGSLTTEPRSGMWFGGWMKPDSSVALAAVWRIEGRRDVQAPDRYDWAFRCIGRR